MLLTDRKIASLKVGKKASERVPDATGSLVAWRRAGGQVEWWYRTRNPERWLSIGDYPTMTLKDARREAASKGAAPAEAIAARGTVGDLLDAYTDHLKAKGKVSHADVKRCFLRAIPAKSALRTKRASAATSIEITDVIARRIRAGVTTEANRLRSHLHAAFAFGAGLDHDPERPEQAARFGLTNNPVTVVKRIERFERTVDRTLTWDEIADYWRALEPEPPIVKATLRFLLAIGGQRMQPILRTQWTDIRADKVKRADGKVFKVDTITMLDKKGKGDPRIHVVPITALAMRELDTLRGNDAPFPIGHFALSDAIARARDRIGGETFDAKDIRRSVETHLGDLGVSSETLAHLLSHGRTGVQAKHYDRAHRLLEKQTALELWCSHLAAAVDRRRDVEMAPAAKRQARRPKARTTV